MNLNSIEHIWDALDCRIRNEQWQIHNIQQLEVVLQEELNDIPQRQIAELILSMREPRCFQH